MCKHFFQTGNCRFRPMEKSPLGARIEDEVVCKSKVVHFGRTNLEKNYQTQDEIFNYKVLATTESEKDRGIIVSST